MPGKSEIEEREMVVSLGNGGRASLHTMYEHEWIIVQRSTPSFLQLTTTNIGPN